MCVYVSLNKLLHTYNSYTLFSILYHWLIILTSKDGLGFYGTQESSDDRHKVWLLARNAACQISSFMEDFVINSLIQHMQLTPCLPGQCEKRKWAVFFPPPSGILAFFECGSQGSDAGNACPLNRITL